MEVIEQVREGMHVVASDGKKVGKVKDLKMGDPERLLRIVVGQSRQVRPVDGPRVLRLG